ncbi:MAG: RNA polymerase sigma factor [Fibrobacterales bacterium]
MNEEHTLLSIRTILNGDGEVFGTLMEEYQHMLYSYILTIAKDEHAAQDILQEALIKIYRKLSLFDDTKGSFHGWILKISKNCTMDYFRKNAKQTTNIEFNDSFSTPIPLESDPLINQQIEQSIADLSTDQAEVIELIYVQQLSYEQASTIASLTIGTLKSRIVRAKQNLKKCMQLKKIWECYE